MRIFTQFLQQRISESDCILKTQNRLVILKTYSQSIRNDSDVTISHNHNCDRKAISLIHHIFERHRLQSVI